MTDQKPGCIHPGDPDGCLGNTLIALTALIAILAARGRNR